MEIKSISFWLKYVNIRKIKIPPESDALSLWTWFQACRINVAPSKRRQPVTSIIPEDLNPQQHYCEVVQP